MKLICCSQFWLRLIILPQLRNMFVKVFVAHLHVPESHEYTGSVICQREDEGHLFKVF